MELRSGSNEYAIVDLEVQHWGRGMQGVVGVGYVLPDLFGGLEAAKVSVSPT